MSAPRRPGEVNPGADGQGRGPGAPAGGSAPARAAAVALSYADHGKAPVVVAKGYGVTAEAIMRTARSSGVYVHESGELVGLLMQVNLDRQIPPALYLAVAEVMAWVARVDARVARSITPAAGAPG